MEHRNGKRFALTFQVEIWQEQQCLGQFFSKNVGYGGLFLDKYPKSVRKGHFLEARMSNPDITPDESFSMKALVVHQSDHGVGLMWADSNTLFFTTLNGLVKVAA